MVEDIISSDLIIINVVMLCDVLLRTIKMFYFLSPFLDNCLQKYLSLCLFA